MRAALLSVVQAGVVAALVTTLAFFLIQLAPGDPLSYILEIPGADPAIVAELRTQFGLDRPLGEQYARWLASAARGDLGYSFRHSEPVATVIARSLPNTLLLMGTALGLALALGVGLGVVQAAYRGSAADRATRALALAFHSMPSFGLAALLLLVGAQWLGLFPSGGGSAFFPPADPWLRLLDRLHHLALPALTLVLVMTASVSRLQRSALLETLPEDFVRTAAAKGLTRRGVLRHALRNALLPVVTLVGLSFPALLGGAVFVERVFTWPGMGTLLVEAVAERDYMLLTGCVLVGSITVVAGSLLADLLTLATDPRRRTT